MLNAKSTSGHRELREHSRRRQTPTTKTMFSTKSPGLQVREHAPFRPVGLPEMGSLPTIDALASRIGSRISRYSNWSDPRTSNSGALTGVRIRRRIFRRVPSRLSAQPGPMTWAIVAATRRQRPSMGTCGSEAPSDGAGDEGAAFLLKQLDQLLLLRHQRIDLRRLVIEKIGDGVLLTRRRERQAELQDIQRRKVLYGCRICHVVQSLEWERQAIEQEPLTSLVWTGRARSRGAGSAKQDLEPTTRR